MNHFPQLSTGALAQYPVESQVGFRTVTSEVGQGQLVAYTDPDFEIRRWHLRFRGIVDSEWQRLADLFRAVGGSYGTFLFVEPGGNMLRWSSDPTNSPWQATGGGNVSSGAADPVGGSGGSTLSGGAAAGLHQEVAAPSSLVCCASVWARSDTVGAKLRLEDGNGESAEADIDDSGAWKRYSTRLPGGGLSDVLRFKVLSGSAALELYGFQLEAQPAPSAFKHTRDQGAVYPGARFEQDILIDTLTGPGIHSGAVQIVWTPSQT